MMAHEHFLQAILADPDSDTPRLIYADWLEEQGDPRGEFIRVQCECAALPLNHERRLTLLHREQELLAQASWLAELRDLCRSVECRRGLVEKVSITAADFLQHAQVLHAAETLLGLHLTQVRRAQLPQLAAMPELSRFTRLDLSGNRLPMTDVLQLLVSPHLPQIDTLLLNRCRLTDADATELASSPHLISLIALHLAENLIGEEGAMSFAVAPHLHHLQWLDLYGNTALFQRRDTPAIRTLRARFGDRVRV